MMLVEVAPSCVVAPELLASARLGYEGTRMTVEVLTVMGSAWVPVYWAPSDGIGSYERNQRNADEAKAVLERLVEAMAAARP